MKRTLISSLLNRPLELPTHQNPVNDLDYLKEIIHWKFYQRPGYFKDPHLMGNSSRKFIFKNNNNVKTAELLPKSIPFVKNQTNRFILVGFLIFRILNSAISYSQNQEAHFQISSNGQSNNFDSLTKSFNQKNFEVLKFKTGEFLGYQKVGGFKKYTILGSTKFTPSLLPTKYNSNYLNWYNSSKKTFTQLISGEEDLLQKIHGYHLENNMVFNNKYMKKYYDSG